MNKFLLLLAGAWLAFASMTNCKKSDDAAPVTPPAVTHYLVTLGAGANWVTGKHINEQPIGDHFNYQIGLFGQGTLKAAGFLVEEDKGFYLQKVTTATEIDNISADDPGIQQGILKVVEKEPISIQLEQVLDSVEVGNRQYFVLNYEPGSKWKKGKRLWEQDLTDHLAYISQQFQGKTVLRGGPFLNVDRGLYIILATDKTAAQTFVNNDPGIKSGLFKATIRPWAVAVQQL
ncbi:MAG: hypothetical protein GC192_04840 [Bacteroidetes bacterium]|nr:hypothetical protein [Bacteroidota bacterium]